MQDILDHMTVLTAAEPADVAAEKPRKVGHNHLAALVEAELPVARPGEVLKVVNANLLEVAQTKPEPDEFEGC